MSEPPAGQPPGPPPGSPSDQPRPAAPSAVGVGLPPAGGVIRPGTTSFSLEPRTVTLMLAGFTMVFALVLLNAIPVPYVVLQPGPVVNTLGNSPSNNRPLIEISDRKTYPAKGQLDLTTVSVAGGPGQSIYLKDALAGWLDDTVAVVPVEQMFPPGQTQQQAEQENAREMTDSQESAAAAALTQLKIPVRSTLTVTGLAPGSAAVGVVKDGDQILSVNGKPTPDLATLRARLQELKVSDPVRLAIRRAGKEQEVNTRTVAGEGGKAALGVYIGRDYELPFKVGIQLNDIGGPSAGMMFALGIIDLLTPGDLTGGKRIAGTGTMDDESGQVGPIGGIRQKLVGARRAGAAYFLAPADNCPEVVGHIPDGLRVVKVATLAQAEDAVKAIAAGRVDALTGC